MQVLKSAYGLTEAPRLWYLRMKADMEACGFTKLKCCRAVFILLDPKKKTTCSVCCMHVDDGLIYGDRSSPVFQAARMKLSQTFKVKEWQDLMDKEVGYLGTRLKQNPDFTVEQHMNNYVEALSKLPVKREAEGPLDDKAKSDLRSAIMRIAWPARKVLAGVLYGTSCLTSEVNSATWATVRKLNALIDLAQKAIEEKESKLHFKKLDETSLRVVTCFDASYAQEEGGRSQSAFITVLTDQRVEKGKAHSPLIELGSSKIQRVVRSTMAAESAALSIALDRQLYVRYLAEALLFGEPPLHSGWKSHLQVPGILVADARSVFDHLKKIGSIPTERQVMLDLLAAKEMVEEGEVKIRWVPTQHMLADPLTKVMESGALKAYMRNQQEYALVQNEEEAAHEKHKADPRRGQRQRRKEKLKEASESKD
jgi:hypothetical protein